VRSIRRSYAGISRSHFSAVFLLLFILFISPFYSVFNAGDAQAALIPWHSNASGTGDGFYWQNGGSDKGLFDNPTLSADGHTLHFSWDNDFNFMAKSLSGKSAITSDRLQVDMFAQTDFVIQGISVAECGIFDISTIGKVSASAAIFITNLSQYEVRSSTVPMNQSMPISATGNGPWSGGVAINDIGWIHLRIVLNNNLIATSQQGSNSFIKKTSFDLEIIPYDNNVPEPATIAVLTLGGFILPLFGKKTNILNLQQRIYIHGRRNNQDEKTNFLKYLEKK